MQGPTTLGDRADRRTFARLSLLLVGTITVVGLLLRLPSFEDSLYGDELSTYFIVTDHSLGRVIDLLQGNSVDLNPPLFFVLAWALERLGDPPQLIRLVSLLAGSAAIPLTYLLGLWTVGRRAALVGGALVALSPFLIFYTTEARAYGLVLCLAVLCTLVLLKALNTDRLGWWAAYSACSCALIYTHYPPLFLLLGQFAWAFWTRPEARGALVAANVAAAIAYLPWLPTVLDNTRSPGAKTIGILNPFGLDAIKTDLGHWFIGHPYIPIETVPGVVAIAMLVAGLASAVLGLAVRVRSAARNRAAFGIPAGAVLILVLALSTPVGLALYSSLRDSVWEARNLTPSWPGLALAVGALVTSADGVLRMAAVALVIGGYSIAGVNMLEKSSQRPAYEEAADFIDRVSHAGDVVVEVPFPSPGPLAPVGDVALAEAGESGSGRPRRLRLGAAPLKAQLRARPYAFLPAAPAADVATRAADLARGGTILVVAPSIALLRRQLSENVAVQAAGPVHSFTQALPPRFRHEETKTFPGFVQVSVRVFRDGG
jgi:Dolichyl-phosphate-mannose-protein mannosyltransferase